MGRGQRLQMSQQLDVLLDDGVLTQAPLWARKVSAQRQRQQQLAQALGALDQTHELLFEPSAEMARPSFALTGRQLAVAMAVARFSPVRCVFGDDEQQMLRVAAKDAGQGLGLALRTGPSVFGIRELDIDAKLLAEQEPLLRELTGLPLDPRLDAMLLADKQEDGTWLRARTEQGRRELIVEPPHPSNDVISTADIGAHEMIAAMLALQAGAQRVFIEEGMRNVFCLQQINEGVQVGGMISDGFRSKICVLNQQTVAQLTKQALICTQRTG